jgi:YfiH family protein
MNERIYYNLGISNEEKQSNLEDIMDFTNTNNAILNTENKTPFLTFPALSGIPFIRHGFSTRLGGVSKGYFESMNLGYTNGDNPKNVDENYRRICGSIGLPVENCVLSHQVHNTVVRLVTEEDKGKGVIRDRDYEGVDGLITNIPGIPLVTFSADCVILYFVDIKNHAIGLCHSGWRGTVKRMGKVTLEAMKEHFGTDPKDIAAVIGPSICMDCYEVSEDVAEAFKNEFNSEQLGDMLLNKGNQKYQLDLWEANKHILLDAGVEKENIHISGVCTSCNKDILFSHRATQGKRGILAAFLMIEEV